GRGGAFPEGVHAAAIEVFALVALVVARVAANHRDGFPDAFGLIRPDARAADLLDEQAAGGESVVAHHLGVHAEAGAARQIAVLRVFFELLRRRNRCLSISRGHDDHLDEPLHVPTRFAELDGHPVEQFRVGRQLAADAEIAGGPYDAGAEDFLPEAVDRDAG